MADNPVGSSASMPTASASDRVQLEDVQKQLIAAWVHQDRSALERLLAQEWTVTHTDGCMSTREEVLRALATGANRLLEGAVDDLKFRVYGDFAVVNGRTQARGEYKGHPYDVKLRFTDVLVRREGGWRVVSSHASRLATEGIPPAEVNKK